MRNRDDRALEGGQELFEPRDRLRVEVIGGFVEKQNVRLREQQTADKATAAHPGQVLDETSPEGNEAHPSRATVRSSSQALEASSLFCNWSMRFMRASRQRRVASYQRRFDVFIQIILHRLHANHDVFRHRLTVVQRRFLRQVSNLDSRFQVHLAVERRVTPAKIFISVDLLPVA